MNSNSIFYCSGKFSFYQNLPQRVSEKLPKMFSCHLVLPGTSHLPPGPWNMEPMRLCSFAHLSVFHFPASSSKLLLQKQALCFIYSILRDPSWYGKKLREVPSESCNGSCLGPLPSKAVTLSCEQRCNSAIRGAQVRLLVVVWCREGPLSSLSLSPHLDNGEWAWQPLVHIGAWTQLFKEWHQTKCPPTDEWVKQHAFIWQAIICTKRNVVLMLLHQWTPEIIDWVKEAIHKRPKSHESMDMKCPEWGRRVSAAWGWELQRNRKGVGYDHQREYIVFTGWWKWFITRWWWCLCNSVNML